jgi:hypothetical protein
MDFATVFAIAATAWIGLLIVVLAICRAAAHADSNDKHPLARLRTRHRSAQTKDPGARVADRRPLRLF